MRDTTLLDNETPDRKPAMSLCVGICQMDEYGYCIGCGRTQAEIDGGDPAVVEAGTEPAASPLATAPPAAGTAP